MDEISKKQASKLKGTLEPIIEEVFLIMPILSELMKEIVETQVNVILERASSKPVLDNKFNKQDFRMKMMEQMGLDSEISMPNRSNQAPLTISDPESGTELNVPDHLSKIFTKNYSEMFKKKK
jgi:hypothetical protein